MLSKHKICQVKFNKVWKTLQQHTQHNNNKISPTWLHLSPASAAVMAGRSTDGVGGDGRVLTIFGKKINPTISKSC
jgi:hypothetical protein